MHLSSLSLSAFRNYRGMRLADLPTGLVGFTGDNGAGKTNILEAISLLAPGRGLRQADLHALQHETTPSDTGPWAVHAQLMGRYGPQELGVGIDPASGRRVVKLNGQKIKSSAEQAELMQCVWLTPAQDRLFLDAASARRKLLDRWVFTADPAHAGRITRLERLLLERNRLLASDRPDPLWLDALEHDLSETALAVTLARLDYLDVLRAQIAAHADAEFPVPSLTLSGFFENRIGAAPAVELEAEYRHVLRAGRDHDRAAEATRVGPHRSDLGVIYTAKNMPARECSTGEQKALLFALFIAHTRVVKAARGGEAPILLLDEIAAHLDAHRRTHLLGILRTLSDQIFLTATGADAFMGTDAHLFQVTNGHVTRPPAPSYLKAMS